MDTLELTVNAPRLAPFNPSARTSPCPACGRHVNGLWIRLVAALRGGHLASSSLWYCAGGKEPTERVSALPIPGFEKDVPNSCLGLVEPHLHVTCNECRYEWFMAVRKP